MKENILREFWPEFGIAALFLIGIILIVLLLVCSPEPLPALICT